MTGLDDNSIMSLGVGLVWLKITIVLGGDGFTKIG